MPFQYQSTGIETRFTSLLEPEARSRQVFAFHRSETLDQWLTQELQHPGSTLRARLRNLPPLITDGLRPAQITAIRNLEKSLAEGRPRALIQMASGGGKTYTACNFIYRLIKHARAAWNPAMQPAWFTDQLFSEKIQPALARASATAIAKRIGVSRWYAGRIREGYRPHPRHWEKLAELVGIGL